MKAKFKTPLSKADKMMIDRIMDECWELRKKEQDQAINRVFKMACLVLCEEWGFGQKRLERFAAEMKKRSDESVDKPEMWYLIDKKLREHGIIIGEDEDIEEREQHSSMGREDVVFKTHDGIKEYFMSFFKKHQPCPTQTRALGTKNEDYKQTI